MPHLMEKTLFWAPRALSIVYICFLSLFSLDALSDQSGFWQTAQALIIHLIPVFVLIAVLALAWRWEWVGAVAYAAAGLLYVTWVVCAQDAAPPAIRSTWIFAIAGPAWVIAGLFLANWLQRGNLRSAR